MTSQQKKQSASDAAARLARRLDVMLFFAELAEEHPNLNTLRNDARRLDEIWGIDVAEFLPQ